jgi:hypothetical protein
LDGAVAEPRDGVFAVPFEPLPFEPLPFEGVVAGTRERGGTTTVGAVDDEPLSWLVTA